MELPGRFETEEGTKLYEIKTKINEIIDYLAQIELSPEDETQSTSGHVPLADNPNLRGFTVQDANAKLPQSEAGSEQGTAATHEEESIPKVGDTEPNGDSETTIRVYKEDGWHVITKEEYQAEVSN